MTLPTSTLSEDRNVNNTIPMSYDTNKMLDMKIEFSNTDSGTTILVNGTPRLTYPEILTQMLLKSDYSLIIRFHSWLSKGRAYNCPVQKYSNK